MAGLSSNGNMGPGSTSPFPQAIQAGRTVVETKSIGSLSGALEHLNEVAQMLHTELMQHADRLEAICAPSGPNKSSIGADPSPGSIEASPVVDRIRFVSNTVEDMRARLARLEQRIEL